jgi:hypothetical protein
MSINGPLGILIDGKLLNKKEIKTTQPLNREY